MLSTTDKSVVVELFFKIFAYIKDIPPINHIECQKCQQEHKNTIFLNDVNDV